jgi:NADH-quinone oxidoreductase subunit E
VSDALGEPRPPSPGPAAPGPADLPVDPALVGGRHPEHPAEEIPELHAVGCPDDLRERIEELMSRYPDRHSASIPALSAVQARYGWCTPEGIRQAAAVMRVTPAYLEGVASFYDLLHTKPVGRHRVLVCTNLSCWMRGGDELLDSFCEAAGCDRAAAGEGGSSSADGELFVTASECLGACDIAPMASIAGRYFGPLSGEDDANEAVQQLLSGAEVLPDKALQKRGAAGGPESEPDPRVAKVDDRSPAAPGRGAEEAAGNA